MKKSFIFSRTVALLAILSMACVAAFARSKKSSITVITREAGSGTRSAFVELFDVQKVGKDGKKKDAIAPSCDVTNSTAVCITQVAQNKSAIGYISLGALSGKVKALSIDGVAPTTTNVKNGSYKIKRPFNIATKGDVSPAAGDFISYLMSREGQAIIDENGYIAGKDDAAPYAKSSEKGVVVITGSSSVHPIMEKLVEAFQKINSDIRVELSMSDSTIGLKSAQEGVCDIAMASRDLKESEKDLTATTIALDGIAIIVNQKNPLNDISSQRVKEIYLGSVQSW